MGFGGCLRLKWGQFGTGRDERVGLRNEAEEVRLRFRRGGGSLPGRLVAIMFPATVRAEALTRSDHAIAVRFRANPMIRALVEIQLFPAEEIAADKAT